MNDVPMFSQQDLKRHADLEIERAIASDRKIQRYKRKQEFWRSFEWSYVWASIVALAVVAAIAIPITLHNLQQPDEVAPRFRIIDESCFVVEEETYCAIFERVHN